jgi:hypothetical protein
MRLYFPESKGQIGIGSFPKRCESASFPILLMDFNRRTRLWKMHDLFKYQDPKKWLIPFKKGHVTWIKGRKWPEFMRKKIMIARGLKYDPLLS